MPTIASSSSGHARFTARLCLVTDHRTGTGVLNTVAAGLAAGVDLVQVRPGAHMGDREAYELTLRILSLCRANTVQCVVDDRVDVALAAGADGVHVGAADLPVRSVRALLGPGAILGATARDPVTALAAQADGATYVGVGPAFATSTKEGLPPELGPGGVGAVAEALDIPVLAIGGVTVDRVPQLLAHGAQGVAVISAFSDADDPGSVAARMREAIDAAVGQRTEQTPCSSSEQQGRPVSSGRPEEFPGRNR